MSNGRVSGAFPAKTYCCSGIWSLRLRQRLRMVEFLKVFAGKSTALHDSGCSYPFFPRWSSYLREQE